MRSREEVLGSIEGVSFDVCVIGGEATGVYWSKPGILPWAI